VQQPAEPDRYMSAAAGSTPRLVIESRTELCEARWPRTARAGIAGEDLTCEEYDQGKEPHVKDHEPRRPQKERA